MSSLLVLQNTHSLANEESDLLDQLARWEIHFLNDHQLSAGQITRLIKTNEILFLLFSREWQTESRALMAELRRAHPLMAIIYYYPQLRSGEFAELYNAGFEYCIVGDSRQINLIKTLNQLWETHWRRIPQQMLSQRDEYNPKRMKQILNFIEKKPIKMINAKNIAEALHISEGQFRAEFKKYFTRSFREFKQDLLRHYETILLFDKKLKPKDIFEDLDYKNISAFSRSFKSRHGRSWQEIIRENTTVITKL